MPELFVYPFTHALKEEDGVAAKRRIGSVSNPGEARSKLLAMGLPAVEEDTLAGRLDLPRDYHLPRSSRDKSGLHRAPLEDFAEPRRGLPGPDGCIP